jgi:spore coat protein SA
MTRTFHLLTESETFSKSAPSGPARWAANVLQSEQDSVVLAASSDNTSGFDPSRIRIVKGLQTYKTFYHSGGNLLPWKLISPMLERVLAASLQDLRAGDTVWIHDRPEFAAALTPFVQQHGARIFLHLHTSQLMHVYRRVIRGFKADRYIFSNKIAEREFRQHFPRQGRTDVVTSGLDGGAFDPAARTAIAMASSPRAQEPVTIAFSARLAHQHDLQTFLEATESLHARQVPVKGVVIGGPDIARPDNVTFEPYDSPASLGNMLRRCDVFCIPSIGNQPAALHMIEALACGLPGVATEGTGIHEAIGVTPGVIHVPNKSDRLAHTFQQLVEDPAQRQQLALAATQTYAREFMWSATRSDYRSALAVTLRPQPQYEMLPSLVYG